MADLSELVHDSFGDSSTVLAQQHESRTQDDFFTILCRSTRAELVAIDYIRNISHTNRGIVSFGDDNLFDLFDVGQLAG